VKLFAINRLALRSPRQPPYATGEFERRVKGALESLSMSLEQMRERREAVQQEMDRSISAVAAMGHSPALVNAISDRVKEPADIPGKIFNAQPDSVSAHVSRIRQFVTERLGNIRQLLYSTFRGPRASSQSTSAASRCSAVPRQGRPLRRDWRVSRCSAVAFTAKSPLHKGPQRYGFSSGYLQEPRCSAIHYAMPQWAARRCR
jgi:hypothetical protein